MKYFLSDFFWKIGYDAKMWEHFYGDHTTRWWYVVMAVFNKDK
jgi:hypothetical protein